MIYAIVAAIILGMLSGYFLFPSDMISSLDNITTIALNILIVSVGIDLGRNKEVFLSLKKKGFKVLLIPASVIAGSLAGGLITGLIFNIPGNISLSISSGFGWYSLSGILLTKLCSAEVGTISFITNVFREIIALLSIPIIAKKLSHLTAIAPAGAASMDSTLPVIAEATDPETVVISFVNGAVLSSLVPILVPLLYKLKL